MHYTPATSLPPPPRLFQRLLFTQLQPVLFLWETSLSSFPLSVLPFLLLRRADRSFGYLLFMSRNSTLTTATSSVPFSLPPSISRHLPFLLYTGGHFQFKFASAEERGAFHRRAHACPDSIKDERFDIWLTFRQAHVYKVHRCWDKSLFPSRYTEFENPLVSLTQIPWLINFFFLFLFLSQTKCWSFDYITYFLLHKRERIVLVSWKLYSSRDCCFSCHFYINI